MKYLWTMLFLVVGCVTPHNFKPECKKVCKEHKGLQTWTSDKYDAAVCECKDKSLQKVELPPPPHDEWDHGHDFMLDHDNDGDGY